MIGKVVIACWNTFAATAEIGKTSGEIGILLSRLPLSTTAGNASLVAWTKNNTTVTPTKADRT